MTIGNPAVYILLVLLFAYGGGVWIALSRRRRLRIAAVRAALLRHNAGGARDRLAGSSAGAP